MRLVQLQWDITMQWRILWERIRHTTPPPPSGSGIKCDIDGKDN